MKLIIVLSIVIINLIDQEAQLTPNVTFNQINDMETLYPDLDKFYVKTL